jgi:cell fate (sporulation/competence/biofilm development) regulator YlbF (YheA/YmcA/DUF963 family)
MAVEVKTRAKIELKQEQINESPPPEFEDLEQEESLKILEPSKTPPFPARNIDTNKSYLFFDWMKQLTEEDWNHTTMLLYRELPVIDRQRVNPKAQSNIEIFGSDWSPTSKKFLEEHGSGKYNVIVNDSNKAVKGKGGLIGKVRFEVNDPNYPPVFVLEELIPEHPSNRSITAKLVAEGKLNLEGKVMTTNQGGLTNDPAVMSLLTRLVEKATADKPQSRDAAMEAVISTLTKLNDQSIQTIRDQLKGDDPDKTVKMITAIKDLMPKHESENSTLALIVKMQGDMAKVQADAQVAREGLMLKMMEIMQAKPSPEDAEDKILGRIATYKELFGGESNGGGRKPSIPELLIEHGAPVVLKVLETIQGFVNIKNYQEGLKKQQQQGAQPKQEGVAPMVEAPQQQQTQQGEGKVVEMQTAEQQIQLVMKQAAPMILDALKRNVTGDEFADSVEKMFGTLEYQKIVAIGKDKIIGSLMSIPEFAGQVLPEVIGKFVDEFIAYGNDDGEIQE